MVEEIRIRLEISDIDVFLETVEGLYPAVFDAVFLLDLLVFEVVREDEITAQRKREELEGNVVVAEHYRFLPAEPCDRRGIIAAQREGQVESGQFEQKGPHSSEQPKHFLETALSLVIPVHNGCYSILLQEREGL